MAEESEHTVDLEADRAIMEFVRESRHARDLRHVGPFALLIAEGTKLRYLNYAIPDDGADPSPAEIDALIDAFRQADRMPRLEFLPSLAPALEGRLLEHGFTLEQRLPLMTCTMTSLRDLDAPAGIHLAEPHDDTTLRTMAVLQHEAFEDPDPVTDRTVAGLRAGIDRGARAVVANDAATGTLVGAAQAGVPAGGATELVGVAVAPSHRRRGIAAAMVAALTRQAFESGLTAVFLEAAPGADGAYRNAGFRRTSTSVHISLPGDSDA
jgi:ribosomal protein S18 acetylase RimI-like enzyme